MTKNMTRKSLALGAAAALVVTGFSAMPANAAGLADTSYVSLSPTSGTEYGMQAADGISFSMTANEASTVSSGNLKFLVTDPSGVVTPSGATTTGGAVETVADNAAILTSTSSDYVSLTHGNASVGDGPYLMWAEDTLVADVGSNDADVTLLAKDTLIEAYVSGALVFFKSPTDLTTQLSTNKGATKLHFVLGGSMKSDPTVSIADLAVVNGAGSVAAPLVAALTDFSLGNGTYVVFPDADAFELDDDRDGGNTASFTALAAGEPAVMTVTGTSASIVIDTVNDDVASEAIGPESLIAFSIPSAVRTAANTYVVDSGITTEATSEVLELVVDGTTSRSVTVQAFMDSNTNGALDSTEFASPVRTVTWTKPSEMVVTTTMVPVVGDAALTAVITTTPVLNGQQLLASNKTFFNAKMTRTLSTSAAYNDNTDTSNGSTATSSVWSDTAKTFTVAVNTNATTANEADNAAGNDLADTWAGLVSPSPVTENTTFIAISTTGLVSVTVGTAHGMVSGDKITMAGDTAGTILSRETTAVPVTVTGTMTFTYQVSETTGLPTTAIAATAASVNDEYTLATYAGPLGLVDKVGAETYTAQATVAGVLQGNIVTTGVVAAVAATSTIATVGTATVQGKSFAAVGANTTAVAAGTLSVPVTVTVTDSAGVAVGAGRAVAFALSASGTADTFKVNAKTADTVYTDANGQAAATITATTGANLAAVQVTATAENLAATDIDLQWQTVAFGLIDMTGTEGSLTAGANTVRDIIKLTSYSSNLMVADQFFNAPAAGTYRLKVSGEGVSGSFMSLVDGKATVTATDTGVFGTSMDTIVDLEKVTSAVWASVGVYTFTANLSTAHTLSVGVAGTTLYGNTVVASAAVAAKALVEIDKRTSTVATPAYATNLVLNGKLAEKTTLAAKGGAVVTVSGPSNILFEEDNVAARGSLTFHTATTGLFEVKAYSTTAQTNTVITFTSSDGTTGTIKVSFTGTGVGEGTSLVITAPAAVKPATTFQVSAKLTDAYGNAVDTATGRVKVTYTGSGIVWGTLPTETDSTGSLSFAVLLGSNDSASAVVTVSYDQNGDGDYVDAKDLTTTSTTEINAAGVAASAAKVNAGSFKGYVALYAKGYKGQRMSAKVGKDWVVVASLASDFERVVEFTGAGVDVAVRIYIDRVLMDTINLTTK